MRSGSHTCGSWRPPNIAPGQLLSGLTRWYLSLPHTCLCTEHTQTLALNTGDFEDWNIELPSCNTLPADVLLDLLQPVRHYGDCTLHHNGTT